MTPPIEACPELLELRGGVRWWLADLRWQEAALEAGRSIAAPETIPSDRLLKAGRRRLVFAGPAVGAPAWVIKAFPLDDLRGRLKHRKYAFSEARNLWLARQRAVPVPTLFGWGGKRRMGIVRWNAVMMERIGGQTITEALADAGDDAARQALIGRCALLFRALFRAGCNHIDLRPEAIHLGRHATEDAVIDFQYCTFSDQPRLATIMAQAGHFAHWWEQQAPADAAWVEGWIGELLDMLEVPDAERREARSILEVHRLRVPSIAERLRQ
jgi:hypothetical protein